MTNIICLKLTSGDELIARVVHHTLHDTSPDGLLGLQEDTSVKLEKVRAIGLQQVGPNQVGVGIMPWTVGDVDAEVVLNFKRHVVAVYAPKDELEKSYLKQTTSIALI